MKTKLTILFLLLATTLMAQELTLKSFSLDEQDLSARTNVVYDANGDPCALVKVGLVVPNATFGGDVVQVKKQTSEYWVYLTDGATYMEVQAPGYQTYSYDFKEPLKKNTTYRLVLNTSSGSTKSKMADLKIITDPTDAKVIIEGENQPLNNGYYRMPLGMLECEVSADQYHTKKEYLDFNKDKQVFTVKLIPMLGGLNVDNSPENQEIAENGTLAQGQDVRIKTPNLDADIHESRGLDDMDLKRRLHILHYLEQFRMACSQKNFRFLENVFHDDALFFSARKAIRQTINMGYVYDKLTKFDYLYRLKGLFERSEYINVKFSDITIERNGAKPYIYGVTCTENWQVKRVNGGHVDEDHGAEFLLWDFSIEEYPKLLLRVWMPSDEIGKHDFDYFLQLANLNR